MKYIDIYSKENLKYLFSHNQNDEFYCKQIFEALYNFYKAFYCSQKYTLKIMITRRSYILFKIFSLCFERSNISRHGSFYTNSYISQLTKQQIESNKILIIDDIIINGRTAGDVYYKLNSICNDNVKALENAYISAFLLNEEGRCLERVENLFVSKNKIATTNEYGWREVSDLLNVFIARVNIGYASYIDTYHLPAVPSYTSFSCQTNKLFSNNDIESFITFPTEKDSQNHKSFFILLEKLNIVPCYRLYKSNGFWTFIPFVYLPTIKIEDFFGYFSCVVDNISDKNGKIDSIKNIIFNDLNSEDKYIFWYEWLTFVLSKCLANVYFQENNFADIEQMSINLSCAENFNDYYASSICINNSIILPSKSYSYSEDEIRGSEEKECVDLFRSLYKANQSSFDSFLFSEYLFQSRCVGQNRALNNLCRLRGIRLDDINYISNELNIKIIKEIINRWDCGDGSGSPKIFGENKKFICTSIINGEQVYRYPFDINNQVTFDFKVLYDNCLLPIRMLIEMFSEFADFMSKKTGNCDYKKFASSFKEDNYDEFENSINSDNICDIRRISNDNFSLIMYFIESYLSKLFRE